MHEQDPQLKKLLSRPEGQQALEDYMVTFDERYGRLPNEEEMEGITLVLLRDTTPAWRVYERALGFLAIVTLVIMFVIAPCARVILEQ